MALRLADVKKTVRTRADGARYVHPKLLDAAALSAAITLALGYLGSRLGRARREVDPDMLLRFFGDPKVARGLVACLNTSYRWRTQEFAEVLAARDVARLAALGLYTPSDLRLYLYDRVNRHGAGFLSPELEREEQLRVLARRLGLTGAKLDQLVALDAEENAVLVRVGPVPEPEQVVALYNYHTVDTLLRNSVHVEWPQLDQAARAALEEACSLYGVTLARWGDGARLYNRADPFGSYARAGAGVARAVYSAAASAPALLTSGRAQVHLPGKAAFYPLEKATAGALTGGTGLVRSADFWPELREDWNRRRRGMRSVHVSEQGGTDGWRLVAAPEPAVVSAVGLALAPYACRRGETLVLLWPVRSAGARGDLLALHEAGLEVLAVATDEQLPALPGDVPHARIADGADGVLAALSASWSGGRVAAGEQALDGLLSEVEARGFLPEEYVAEALGCVTASELAARLRALDPARGVHVPGLGLCSPSFAAAMRKGLRRRPRRAPAA